ncbi:MAG: LPS-assembly protein LptD, partial [Rhodoferax sp.]
MDEPERKALRSRFVLTPVAWVACALLHGTPTLAQAMDDAPLTLQRSLLLQEKIPPAMRQQLPTFVSGEHVSGETDLDTEVDGNAVLRRGDTMIRADRINYNQPQDLARATGHVHVNRDGNVYDGPVLQLKLDAFEGFFTSPDYRFLNTAYGHASRIDFIDDTHSVAHNATYTTCQRQPGPNWMPAWIFKATTLQFDTDDEMGRAQGAQLRFKGVPILPFPNMSFPLTDKRMSGLLPPTVGIDSVNGLEVVQPYYWDIAPNRDATLYPDLMSRRGLNLGGEFRYLEVPYQGQMTANYMPTDTLRGTDRWSYASTDAGTINTGVAAIGNLGFNVNLNRV